MLLNYKISRIVATYDITKKLHNTALYYKILSHQMF